jgi:GT2 family glycosyltransferase
MTLADTDARADEARPVVVSPQDATVVIATHDLGRWPFLVAAVESVFALDDGAMGLIIAVDHNDALLHRITKTWPDVTAVPNRHAPGASGTRNSGAEHAVTPYIVFLDDDARAHKPWLTTLLAPFADADVVGTGGGVRADWQTGRPAWFPEEFDWAVGASYRGMPATTHPIRNVWGENMAVRADVFRAVGGFRLDFGKVSDRSRPEDTDLCIRMGRHGRGGRWIYVPDALVDHHVPAARSKLTFFIRRCYLEGRGKVEMARLLGRQERLDDERDYLRRTLPRGVARSVAAAAVRREPRVLLRAAAIVVGVGAAAVGAAGAFVTLGERPGRS